MSINLGKAIAIIPARSGSKGVPDKNIREIGGFPLISYSIMAAKIAGIERIIVSTDSEDYAQLSIAYGAEVPFLRSKENSSDNSTDLDLMNEVIAKLMSTESSVDEYIIHLRPTTPIRSPEVILNALKRIEQDKNSTSLRSGHLCSESPLKWFMKDIDEYFQPMDASLSSEDINRPRQDFPDVFIPNGYVDILKSDFIMKNNDLHGSKMIVFETERVTEVDTMDDLEYLEFELNNKQPDLLKMIKEYNREK